MQVLIIPSWYFPAGSASISGRMFHQHALALIEAGVETTMYTPQYGLREPLFPTKSFSIEAGVPTHRINRWWPPKANAFLYRAWINRCASDLAAHIQQHGRPDIIHAQSYQAAAICAALQAKIKIPFVYTERLSSFLTGDIPTFHKPFFRSIFESANVITCVSPGLAAVLQQHSQKEVRVIPNFVDSAIFFADAVLKKNHAFTWITVGEPSHTKGLDLIIQVFARIKKQFAAIPMQLIIVDAVPEQKELMALATALGIGNEIRWTGLISQPQLAHQLRKSNAYISGSRVETFGKATIEAQASGLPVVATKTVGSTFIMNHPSQGELAEINNVDSLVQAMGRLYASYSTYNAETIATLTKKRFGKDKIMREWLTCYTSLKA